MTTSFQPKATILFFHGEDTFRSTQKLRALKNRYVDASLGDTNLATLDGATVRFEDFVRQVQAFPFLAKSRLVIVNQLLGSGRKEVQELMAEYLSKVPETTVLVFFEAGRPDQRTKLFRALAQPKVAQEFSRLTGSALARWIASRCAELELTLSPPLIDWLGTTVGGDLWRMNQELSKLADYQRGVDRPLTLADLVELVTESTPSDIFRLVDHLVNRRGTAALAELVALRQAGTAELQILALIVYQYRHLLLTSEAYHEGIRSPATWAKLLKIHPFVARKLGPLVARIPMRVWEAYYQRLLAYDVAVKTGALEPRLGLELLIAEFSQPVLRTTN